MIRKEYEQLMLWALEGKRIWDIELRAEACRIGLIDAIRKGGEINVDRFRLMSEVDAAWANANDACKKASRHHKEQILKKWAKSF